MCLFNGQTPTQKLKYMNNNNTEMSAVDRQLCHVILDKSAFYAEAGGQGSDNGILVNEVTV